MVGADDSVAVVAVCGEVFREPVSGDATHRQRLQAIRGGLGKLLVHARGGAVRAVWIEGRDAHQ